MNSEGFLTRTNRSNSIKRAFRIIPGSQKRQPTAVFSIFHATGFGVALAGAISAQNSYASPLTSIEKE